MATNEGRDGGGERENGIESDADIEVEINGLARRLRTGCTVAQMLGELGIDASAGGVAVAVDGAVVPRSRWPASELTQGSRIELIRAVQGG